MKLKPLHFLLPLITFALYGCVTSKTPVGDKVAVLNPQQWNAKWRGEDGSTIRTSIQDAKLGIVEVKEIKPWWKHKPGDTETAKLLVRTLGNAVIANFKQGNEYGFGRVSISDTHFVFFGPDESVFEDLIRRHEIPGRIQKNKIGNGSAKSYIVDRFSERDYERLKGEGFDMRSLFDEDPSTVYIRDHGWW